MLSLASGELENYRSNAAAASASYLVTDSVRVQHEFTADTSLVLAGRRSLNEPDLPGMSHFVTTGGYAELSQKIAPKLSGAVRGSFVEDEYYFLDGSLRTDRTRVVGGGLRFAAAKWLAFSLDYNYHARSSTLPQDEYVERSTMITATASM